MKKKVMLASLLAIGLAAGVGTQIIYAEAIILTCILRRMDACVR